MKFIMRRIYQFEYECGYCYALFALNEMPSVMSCPFCGYEAEGAIEKCCDNCKNDVCEDRRYEHSCLSFRMKNEKVARIKAREEKKPFLVLVPPPPNSD